MSTGDRERVFLDELTPEMGTGQVVAETDCSLLCYGAERLIARPLAARAANA